MLVLFPISGHPLQNRYHGPYTEESKVGEVDYIVKTPDRHKSRQLCHINILKEYVDRNDDGIVKPVCLGNDSSHDDTPEMVVDQNDNSDDKQHEYPMKLQNSDVLANLDGKLDHLSDNVQCKLKQLIHEREEIFPDVPSRTNVADHDVDVGDHEATKQHPCRVNPLKRAHLNKEIEYMLENNIIDHSKSEWSSPCILVQKPDGSFRFVTDFLRSVLKDGFVPDSAYK